MNRTAKKTKEITIDFKTTPFWGLSYASAFEGQYERNKDCILWISKIKGRQGIIEQYSIDPRFMFLIEKRITAAQSSGKDSVTIKVNELVSTAIMESVSLTDFEDDNALFMIGADTTKKPLLN